MNSLAVPRLGTVLLALALATSGLATPAVAAETNNAIDTNSRNDVVNAYKTRYLPSLAEDINWTGSVDTCDPGTQSASSLANGEKAINFFRGLSGLDSISLTTEQNTKAQAAALMMHAERHLDHNPTSAWRCYSEAGKAGAGTSNLHYSDPVLRSMSQPIRGYMDDDGYNNADVGHRRWLLHAPTTTMGIGTTSWANAIVVLGGATSATRATPDFIAYPNAGYFPMQLLPPGRWSFSSPHDVDFSQAKVTVTDAAGTDMQATSYPAFKGYGPNTVVFDVPSLQTPQGSTEVNYTVKVTGMVRDGVPLEHTYTVKLIDGNVEGTSTPDPTPPQVRENIVVTPAPPVFGESGFTIPSTPGVRYFSEGTEKVAGYYPASNAITVTAVARYGYELSGTASWFKDFRPVPWIDVEATPPIFGNSTYTIPSKTGVQYWVEGVVRPPGTYPAAGEVTVIAGGLPGYNVVGTIVWTKVFPYPTAPAANPTIKTQGSIVSIDASGNLWNYGNLKSPRVKIGSGWGIFSDIFVSDWNTDGTFDIVAKTKAGQLYVYKGLRTGGFVREVIGAGGWQNYSVDVGFWKKTDRYPSIVAKHKTTGKLYVYANKSGSAPSAGVQISAGWQNLDIHLLDWNRDGAMDIVARTTAGQMLLYRTNGSGSFLNEKRPVLGSGWHSFNSLTVIRGLGGTGTHGLLARTKVGGLVYYQANKAAWAAPKTLGNSGWSPYVIANH